MIALTTRAYFSYVDPRDYTRNHYSFYFFIFILLLSLVLLMVNIIPYTRLLSFFYLGFSSLVLMSSILLSLFFSRFLFFSHVLRAPETSFTCCQRPVSACECIFFLLGPRGNHVMCVQ